MRGFNQGASYVLLGNAALQASLVSTACLPLPTGTRLREMMGAHQWALLPVKTTSWEGYVVKRVQSEV